MRDLIGVTWRKSSYSGTESNCVELAVTADRTAIRDSKAPEAGTLLLTSRASAALLSALRRA
ncbi:DUF397 domain-containing protein [Amycolatopsis cihanbeyliensis]|uniref:Uncharacterized protein DUF397 n=1 Tax=Amycolatopsis cihanbeyliensis TaxID=1128664 RepID=A0A542DJM8_AMYCI|nr:DUF397 domain-containing protein [Amycolatopsis cihanbeyliensis]TQJ03298.1 uncharacterized protein DUF397 [Amycolatopsis cihanbeyliensis]